MAQESAIEWTEATWNPIAGCTPVSPGCLNCFAAKMSHRLNGMGQAKYRGLTVLHNGRRTFNGNLRFDEGALSAPLRWRKPKRVFVNSMSDLFHEDAPFEFVDKVFAVMALCPQHTFQILTKRPERMAEYLTQKMRVNPPESSRPVDVCAAHRRIRNASEVIAEERSGGGCWREHYNNLWPLPNVWLGTSAEDQTTYDARREHLIACPAKLRFLSLEPLLGPIELPIFPDRAWIRWVIVGGESGPNSRPMNPEWVRSIRNQCLVANVPFFFKQYGEWRECPKTDFDGYMLTPGRPTKIIYADGESFDYNSNWDASDDGVAVERIGKKAAGRMLDGREWSEFPVTHTPAVATPEPHTLPS